MTPRVALRPGRATLYIDEPATANDLFEREYAARNGQLLTMKVEPLYEPLLNHPRFEALRKKVGFLE
jgi:hypothetical protein